MKPIEPVCPSFCRYRLLCPRQRQMGINRLFVEGRLKTASDCIAHQPFGVNLRKRYGVELEGSAEELFERVAERIAIQEEAS